MSFPDNLAKTRVVILGLGLMGGSLALALRGRCRTILAVDPDPGTLDLAREKKIVDDADPDLVKILPHADLVVLAAPVRTILRLIPQIATHHPGEAVVIDLGSTKSKICQELERLPPRLDPIGGHPMCGKETAGLSHADGDLFREAAFVLTPLLRTSSRAHTLAIQLVEAIGARVVWLDAQTHDQWAAATSHTPYLLSTALALATPPETAPLIGPGFLSTSRLASSSTTMMTDILQTNRENILTALGRIRSQINELEDKLKEADDLELVELLKRGAAARDELMKFQPKGGGGA